MFVLPSIERPRVNPVLLPLLLLLLAGCGGGSTRSLAPEPDGGARSASGVAAARDARAPGVFASRNLLPTATILDPAPDGLVIPLLATPVTIQWTGQDPDGHLREYRYRVFGSRNPDFPAIADFVQFIRTYPDSVLSLYSPDFAGWERVRVRKGSEPASATYSALAPFSTYTFAVVAIDQRGGHDADLARDRNVLDFALTLGPGIAARR